MNVIFVEIVGREHARSEASTLGDGEVACLVDHRLVAAPAVGCGVTPGVPRLTHHGVPPAVGDSLGLPASN